MIDQRRSDRDAFLKRQHGTEWVKPQMKVWFMVVSFFAKHQPGVPEWIFFSQASYGGLELGWLDLFSFIGLVQFGVYGDVKEATLP